MLVPFIFQTYFECIVFIKYDVTSHTILDILHRKDQPKSFEVKNDKN